MTTSQPKLRTHGLELFPEPFAHDGIERLAVIVHDPPGVAQPVLPALGERLEDVAFVHLGIADQRNHPPFAAILHPAMRFDVVLHQRGEQRLRNAETDRAGREIDVVDILGARGIGLRALEAAKVLQLLTALPAEQILDGVEHRAGMRLHRDAILGPQHMKIQRRHDGGERSGRSLVGRRPSTHPRWCGYGWRDGWSRTTATAPCGQGRTGFRDERNQRAWRCSGK
ncbi:hypothetical protein ACVWXO_010430 [Bradyrhizobium sp. LM2.7]